MLPKISGEGRAGSDPELSFTPSGHAVCKVSVACSKRRQNAAGAWEDVSTTWLTLVTWRDKAEQFAEHVRKGDKIVFTGELDVREYETRDGKKGKAVEVDVATWGITPRQQTQRETTPVEPDPWAAPDENPPF